MIYAIVCFFAAIIPAILLVIYYYKQDRGRPEPKGLLLLTFLGGIVIIIPVIIIELIFEASFTVMLKVSGIPKTPADLMSAAFKAFMVAGFCEELFKMLLIRAFAYRLLGRREYSRAELGQRITRKWPQLDRETLGALVESLVEENLLSDERFAESYVRSAIRKHQGPLKIRAALRARGVADALIASELDRFADQWTDLAWEWLERQNPGPLDFEARGKFYRRLVNRGFTHDQAMDALGS